MSKEILHFQVQDVNTETTIKVCNDITFEVHSCFSSDLTGNQLYVGWLPTKDWLTVAKFSAFDSGSSREWDGYLMAFSHHIPTATPIALVSRERRPHQGLITDYIDGPSLGETHTEDQLYQVGTELRRLSLLQSKMIP